MKQNHLNLLTLLLLISSTFGQEILLNNIRLDKEKSINSLKFSKPEWDQNLDFAVYGWIDFSQEFWSLATVYRMSQTNKTKGDNNMFDRVLTLQVIQTISGGKDLDFTTYDVTTNNPYNEMSISLSKQETEKEVFVYQGYSSKLKKLFAYVYINEQKTYRVEIGNISHSTSKFYEVFINPLSQFVGQVSCLKLVSGESAYRESEFQSIMSKECQPEIPYPPLNTINLAPSFRLPGSYSQDISDNKQACNSREFGMYFWIKYSELPSKFVGLFEAHFIDKKHYPYDAIFLSLNQKGQFDVFPIDNEAHVPGIFLKNDKYASLKNQWVFIYQGVDFNKKLSYTRVQTANGDYIDSAKIPIETDIKPLNIMYLVLGNDDIKENIEGRNWSFIYGDGAYMEDKFERIMGQIPK